MEETPSFRMIFTVVFVLMSTFSFPIQPATCRPHNNNTDLESLLSFKAHFVDPSGILAANWTADTSFCSWIGVRCSRRQHQRVTAIKLRDMPLQGTISPHLGNLSFLSYLLLSNISLMGSIPESLGQLPRLAYIAIQESFVSGQVPSTIFNMSSLISFYVPANNLSGSIPSNYSFNMLPRIRHISLARNQISGEALSCFAQCRNLEVLALTDNRFSGTIPAEIGSLSELTILGLGFNLLTGSIPTSLGNLTKLTLLELMDNNLIGKIPEELGKLGNLERLDVYSNNLIGSIPFALFNDSMLTVFCAGMNKLTGSVPAEIGKSLPQLTWFNVAGNQLSGGLEFLSSLSNCRNLMFLKIQNNALEGVLPNSIGNLSTSLQGFYADTNHFKGNIPGELGNLSGLNRLSLNNNELTGTLPVALARLESLQYMILGNNNISGLIPLEFGLLKNLNRLVLQYNPLTGPIPDSFSNLSMIQFLYLDNNKLSSSIPQSLWTLESLLELDLSGNALNGSLPPQVGNLNHLTYLNLSMNLLSGNISSALGNLQMLYILDLSKNLFEGQIPQSFDKLISIGYLNLSYNFLSGAIPQSLANLSYLNRLNLSFNKLRGQVPQGGVFANSSIPSLEGNEELCGAPQLHLPPCHTDPFNDKSRRQLHSLKYVLVATTLGVVLLLLAFLCLFYAFYWRRKPKSLANNNCMTDLDDQRVVSYHELVRATTNFSEENVLGRGGFGSVFRGCLDDGLIVAVKVVNLDVEGASKSFDAECQVLKTVRHRNLIKIISVCSNLDFKALILQFMPKGSLEKWLYSENCFLNLIQRLNVMVDVSMALEYLHHHHPHVVLHCDLKPTNILLDEELAARVSDFGISKLLLGESKSMATASMPGTIGYIAPEYSTTGAASRMGDVYSFGILLLETFTRRRPVDSMFGEHSSLREWIRAAHPNAVLDVVDENLLKHHATDGGPSQDLSKVHQCLSSVIELGLLCSSYSPKERIPMTDIAARLQKIKMEYLST